MNCPSCQHVNRPNAHFCANCRAPLLLQDKYRITRLLGRGGYGAVYQAEHTGLGGALYAIKELYPDPAAASEQQQAASEQFRLEASILARLNHVTLPKVMDVFNEGSRDYLVMEYIEGETLEERLARTGAPLPEAQVLAWAHELCDVLNYLHTRQPSPVIHRDVKPANIKITPDGKLKLIDFGIAKLHIAGVGTKGAARAVSPPYSPIEQYGKGTDARSDIYALGVTLYQLLTNRLPPEAPDRASEPVIPLRQLNPARAPTTEAIVLKAMAEKSAERFQSVSEMKQALTAPARYSQPTIPVHQPAGLTTQPSTYAPVPTVIAPSVTRYPLFNWRWMAIGVIGVGILLCVAIAWGIRVSISVPPAASPTMLARGSSAPSSPTVLAPSSSVPSSPSSTPSVAAAGLASTSPRVLRIALNTSYPDTFDPQKASYSASILVLRLTYEGLLSLDEKGNVGLGGADKWTLSQDGTAMTFHIRDGLKRADGTPITAKDYEYALRREMDPRVPDRVYSDILRNVKGAANLVVMNVSQVRPEDIDKALDSSGVKATDERTLVVSFDAPVGFWPYIAATWVAFPTDKKQVDRDPNNWWSKPEAHNGNGPFVIKSMVPDKQITLVANPTYWRGRSKLDRIELYFTTDNAVGFQMYKNSEVDVFSNPLFDTITTVSSDATLRNELLRYPAAWTTGIAFNQSKKPFDDVNVRKAFSAALDREGYLRDTKIAGKAYTRWIPPGIPGAQPSQSGVPGYDPQAAIQYLTNAGYASGGKVDCVKLGDLKITFSSSSANSARAQVLANNFARVFGCAFPLDPVDTTTYNTLSRDNKTAPQFRRAGWIQDYPHPQNWLSIYWTCTSFGFRYGSYCNKDLESLLARADREPDVSKSMTLYQQAEDMLLRDVPYAFAYYNENAHLVKPWVLGLKDHIGASDANWPGEFGPVWTYDMDLSKVPANYPKQ